MDKPVDSFKLKYTGERFAGARMPVDVLPDLNAFRDLLLAYAREEWFGLNKKRKRLPKGFDKSFALDLIGITDGSAVSELAWNKGAAQETIPGLADDLGFLIQRSYEDVLNLVSNAASGKFPKTLSVEHIRALNKFGSGLREGETIEFLGSKDNDGNVISINSHLRKELITQVSETYHTRYEGIGSLLGCSIPSEESGYILVHTDEYGEIKVDLDPAFVKEEFDGNIGEKIQFDLQIELDHHEKLRRVVDAFDVNLIDEKILESILRCQSRIESIAELKTGWLDGSGKSINPESLKSAQRLLKSRPSLASAWKIYPTEDGGVLFEFSIGPWDFSIDIRAGERIEFYGINTKTNEEMAEAQFDSIDEKFLSALDAQFDRFWDWR